MPRISTSFRLSEAARKLVEATAAQLGVSRTSVIEMAIREFVQRAAGAGPGASQRALKRAGWQGEKVLYAGIELANAINEGNPDWTPYDIEALRAVRLGKPKK
jgi:hypothetical protein